MSDLDIPSQREFNNPAVDCCGRDAADCDCDGLYDENGTPKRVKTTFVCCITVDESIIRHKWRGKTEAEIMESFNAESFNAKVQEFMDLLDSTDEDKMIFHRYVMITDPD